MPRKIFVSYKYADTDVLPLRRGLLDFEPTTVRRYVDILQQQLSQDHINKGEMDGEDLSSFKDSTIRSRLRDKIFDSSITIVLISKGMKSYLLPESEQWIPWEISYSLRESNRGTKRSRPNAILAVVLPDINGRYDYYLEEGTCSVCNCRTLKTNVLFSILEDNMFNQKQPISSNCSGFAHNTPVFYGNNSYIESVKWDDFINNVDFYIENALRIRDNIDDYNISKSVTRRVQPLSLI